MSKVDSSRQQQPCSSIFQQYKPCDSKHIHSGIVPIIEKTHHLPKETFLSILQLESKIEINPTKNRMNKLVVLYSQLVEHYNMIQDPAYLYFLEKIRICLSRIEAFKLYFQDPNSQSNGNGGASSMSISIPFMSKGYSIGGHHDSSSLCNEENWQAYLQAHNSFTASVWNKNQLYQQQQQIGQSSMLFNTLPIDYSMNIPEQKISPTDSNNYNNTSNKPHKTGPLHDYRHQKRARLQKQHQQQQEDNKEDEEEYDLEKKRNERNIKLNVFKEVLAHAQGKHSEVRQMLSEYEQCSKQKDNIVQSDIESQMNSIQKRIQIKRETQFKKSVTLELNTPRKSNGYGSSEANTNRNKQKKENSDSAESCEDSFPNRLDNTIQKQTSHRLRQQSESPSRQIILANDTPSHFSEGEPDEGNNQDNFTSLKRKGKRQQSEIIREAYNEDVSFTITNETQSYSSNRPIDKLKISSILA